MENKKWGKKEANWRWWLLIGKELWNKRWETIYEEKKLSKNSVEWVKGERLDGAKFWKKNGGTRYSSEYVKSRDPDTWWLWWIWLHLSITSCIAQQKEEQKEMLWLVQWFSSCYTRTHRQIWPRPHNEENRLFPNTATCQTTWHHTSEVYSLEVHFKITGQCDHVMYHVAPLRGIVI
jgi:hypothetical protein